MCLRNIEIFRGIREKFRKVTKILKIHCRFNSEEINTGIEDINKVLIM
jgi:hypothetical protein